MIIVADLHLNAKTSSSILTILMDAALSDGDRTMIIAGDLIRRSHAYEYSDIVEFLRNGISAGIKFVCTPGNHDIGGIFTGKGPIFKNSGWKKYMELLQDSVFQQKCVISTRDFDSLSVIGEDIFIALRTTHSRLLCSKRIDGDQINWAVEEMSKICLTKNEKRRLHLVAHHSFWKMKNDRHGSIHRKTRLENRLLKPFNISTIINGHNHRFSEGYIALPKSATRVYHIQAPTLSKRTRGNPTGYIEWNPADENPARMVELR